MPPRRPQAGSALTQLTRQQRHCLESGNFADLTFDSPEHHRAAWQAVRRELLAHYRRHRPGELPAAMFAFELELRHGPRLTQLVKIAPAAGRRAAHLAPGRRRPQNPILRRGRTLGRRARIRHQPEPAPTAP
jgi:hypothetical protein